MKIGRNDKCPCGSGLKYKKCHINKPFHVSPDPNLGRSIKERNVILLNGINDIFFGKNQTWDEMRSDLTGDKVSELYKLIGWLWPLQTKIDQLLPAPDKTLRGLYVGDSRPQDILQNIVRYSLYTEEIIVVSPFFNPYTMKESFSPVKNPNQYRQDTLELIYFALSLAPWIEAGIVNMIPDPLDFDYKFRMDIYSMADKRYQANKDEYDRLIKEVADIEGKEEYKRILMRMPIMAMRSKFKKFKPEMTDKELDDQIKYMLKQRKNDPLLLDEEMSGEAEMKIKRMGANLELGMYLGQSTGSYLYTNNKFQWSEIMSTRARTTEDSELWSPLTRAFQTLDFTFLNNVDPKFAYKLKEEGRLGGFRNYLRRVWDKIESDASPNQANKAARELGDELHEQYAVTKEEWAKIDKEIINSISKNLRLSKLIPALVTGSIDWRVPAVGFAISGVNALLSARKERKEFKANVPLAVFLDLDKKDKKLK